MPKFLRVVVLLAWALWFGGVMGLFLSVQILFRQTDRPVFLAAAPRLFVAFERYQLALALTCVLATIAWRIFTPSARLTTLLVLFLLGSLGAMIESTQLTPRIEALRIQGATHTPQFLRLHGLSMCVYMAVAIALLIAGVVQAGLSKASLQNLTDVR